MIRALALETSGRLGSVAVAEDGRLIAEDVFAHGLKHAAEMIPRIDLLVKNAGWTPGDIGEIYVSAGPGSFTGLRIGVTLAKTLAFAVGAKVVAVPSVEVLACNAPPEAREVVVVLDAKREQIFTARLRRAESGDGWEIVEPAHLDSLSAMLSRAGRPVHLIGEGIPFHEKYLPANDASIIVTSSESWRAEAKAVVELGHRLARRGVWTDPQKLLPVYIRKPEAEEKYEQRQAAGG